MFSLWKKNNEFPIFAPSGESGVSLVRGLINGSMDGYFPLVDESCYQTEFVAIGTKNGLPLNFKEFKRKFGKQVKLIFNTQNGPFLFKNYDYLVKNFDGIFDLDYNGKHGNKSMFCNHSMMARSMPYHHFFWEPTNERKEYDFSILTWVDGDKVAKRWDRGLKIAEYLCGRGLKGLVVLQRGDIPDVVTKELAKYYDSKILTVVKGGFTQSEFNQLMSKSKYSIFPNNLDAFPKVIIESLLSNRPVIISNDLLLGKDVLSKIEQGACTIVDFSSQDCYDLIYMTIVGDLPKVNIRELWLDSYCFDHLSSAWASEFNRLFNTKFKRLFFMNHLQRLRENNLI